MGVRIRYEFTSENEGIQWKCDIHDSDYAASINTAQGNGFQITYNGNGDAPLANIKGSSCRLELLWTDADTFMTGFINDLKAANEHEFALVIYKDNNLYWVGNITGDSLSWGNENTSRSVQIDAIDGLGRLRDMKYDKITTGGRYRTSTTKQVYEVILDLLSLNNLDQFWGASDPYIEFEPHWILNTSYKDWIDRLSIPRQALYDYTEKSKFSPRLDVLEGKPAYECLELILSHLNMRILHSDGRYWLQQVMGMSTGTAATRYTYYKGNTPVSSSPYKWWQASATSVARNSEVGVDNDILAGGRFSYLPGLQRAEIEIPEQLMAYKDVQQGYTKTILNPTNCPFTETDLLGIVQGGAGTGNKIKVFVNLSTLSVGLLSEFSNRYFVRLTFKIEAGSYRLYNGGRKDFKTLTWTTNASDTVVYDLPKTAYLLQAGLIVLETPEIPWTSETVNISITYDVIDTKTNASYTNTKLTYKIDYVGMSVVSGDGEVGHRRIVCPNPSITKYENNTVYKHPDYLFNDFANLTDWGSFKINTTTTNYAFISAVDSGHSTDELISETLVQDAMSLQMYPIQVYEGGITGSYEPYLTWEYDSNIYVFNGGSFDAKFDEWNCQWWQSSPEIGTIANPNRDDGRGWEYDGDDRVKPYVRTPTPWDHYGDVKDVMYLEKIGGSGGDYNSTYSSLTIQSATESLLKSGDVVCVFNPDTLEKLGEFTLSADIDSSDTSMSFTSSTLTENIPPDAIVMLKGSEGTATPMLRTNEIQIDGEAITTFKKSRGWIWKSGATTYTPVSSGFQQVELGTLTNSSLTNFTYASHTLTYNGATTAWFNISFKAYVSRSVSGLLAVSIYKGSAIARAEWRETVGTTPVTAIGHVQLQFANGDTFYLIAAREDGTGTITLENVNIEISQI